MNRLQSGRADAVMFGNASACLSISLFLSSAPPLFTVPHRDACAHLLLPLNKCRLSTFFVFDLTYSPPPPPS